jgi:Rrf2 family transcriptional regulator, iron-sulfur cluster assembly transcription factor
VRLTKGADYGARGALYLASKPQDTVVLVSEIAEAENLPESYLAKIFQDLAKEGIVRSHRGAKGGFSLARPATEITLREVVEAIEGPITLSRCLAPWEGCDKQETCALHPVLREAQATLLQALESASLADLAARKIGPNEISG